MKWLVFWWIAAGIVLLPLLDRSDVARTQEARVLATAREMLERGGVRNLLVPHLNGEVRLQKPPLAYWLTAASFKTLGVSDFAGRLPAALAGWLTVGATFLIARRPFGDRAAALAAAALFGSFMIVHNGTLAETDVWVALFTTLAVGAIVRCFDGLTDAVELGDAPPRRGRFVLWAHASAVAIGLLVLAKGPPAFFPLLFLLAMCAVRRRWGVLGRWALCGAPLTALLIAAPWFVYIASLPEAKVVMSELGAAAAGAGHRAWFIVYFPQLLVATTPWTGVMVLALIAAVRVARVDARVMMTLLWFAAVFLPLCIVGQKQPHYLMPALPPLAVLTGWLLDRAVRRATGEADAGDARIEGYERAAALVVFATLCVGVAAVVALPVSGYVTRGRMTALDGVVGGLIGLGAGAGLWLLVRRGLAAATAALAALAFPIVALVTLGWGPTLREPTYRDVAAALDVDAASGESPPSYAFYVEPANLRLCWALRRVIPSQVTPEGAAVALAGAAPPMLITSTPRAPSPPPGYRERRRWEVGDRPVILYAPSRD
ncbi:MAG: phospholipid carrier-dependent glycosyltransferase [Tepidisphaeraceae bacterium]